MVFSPVLFFLLSLLVVEAQTKLGKNDKAQIIAAILKKQKFKDLKYLNSDDEETVYLLADSISFEQLPKIKDIKFVSITEKQIDEMKKTGVAYYSFSEFEVTGKIVKVTFGRDYISFADKHGYGYATTYECRKISRRWKIRGGKPSGWVGESN